MNVPGELSSEVAAAARVGRVDEVAATPAAQQRVLVEGACSRRVQGKVHTLRRGQVDAVGPPGPQADREGVGRVARRIDGVADAARAQAAARRARRRLGHEHIEGEGAGDRVVALSDSDQVGGPLLGAKRERAPAAAVRHVALDCAELRALPQVDVDNHVEVPLRSQLDHDAPGISRRDAVEHRAAQSPAAGGRRLGGLERRVDGCSLDPGRLRSQVAGVGSSVVRRRSGQRRTPARRATAGGSRPEAGGVGSYFERTVTSRASSAPQRTAATISSESAGKSPRKSSRSFFSRATVFW